MSVGAGTGGRGPVDRPVPIRRPWARYGLAVGLPGAVAAALATTGEASIYRPGVAMLACVVVVAALGGRRAAGVSAVTALGLIWLLTRPPGGSLAVTRGAELAAQLVFAASAVVVVLVMARIEAAWARLAASEREQAKLREDALADLDRTRRQLEADLNARRQAERDLRVALDERDFVARTLQASLLPAQLPHIPGIDLAARYLPAPEGHGIGGDFYDVFPDDDGRWHVLIGDVSGRGTEAAALTALCRHTLRAGGLQHSSPARVLRLLNDAIRHSGADGRFCTVAYAVLEPSPEPGRWQMRLALGGHHQPRLLRSGVLHRIGWHGTIVGAFTTLRVVTQSIELVPGDELVIFTDGLIEQRRVGFGEDDFDALLTRLSPRGLGADELASAVEREAGDVEDREDDMALVILRLPGAGPSEVPAPEPVIEVEQDYPAEIPSVRRARALAVRASGLDGGRAETLALLTSELASNAVLHARTPFTLQVTRSPDRVRVAIRDGSRTAPRLRDNGTHAITGRGVRLVDQLSDGWGTRPLPEGKEVWFDLATPGGPAPRSVGFKTGAG